jgi:hypothetical protein
MNGTMSLDFLPLTHRACQVPISDSNGGGCLKEMHIPFIIRVIITTLRLTRAEPAKSGALCENLK